MRAEDMNKVFEKMPKAHPGIEEWIYTFCAENAYMIYDRKTELAVCTRCGKVIACEDWFRHNEYGECPNCGHSIRYKSNGRGRDNLDEQFRILECSHRGKTVWACSWEIRLSFQPFGRPEIHKFLADIFTINDKEAHHYKQQHWYYPAECLWNESGNIKLPHIANGGMYWNCQPLENVYIYRANLENVFTKSCMKYLWDAALVQELDAFELINYMAMGVKWQAIELLHKAGFQRIIAQRLNAEPGSGCCYWNGSCLQKILRLPMRDIRHIRDKNPSFRELETYRGIPEKHRRNIPWELMCEISSYRYPGDWQMPVGFKAYERKVNEYTDLKTWFKYIEQRTTAGKDDNLMIRKFGLNDWTDYIDVAQKMGMDLRKKKIMFPEDFWKAHDETIEAFTNQQIEINNRFLCEIKERLDFGNDELTVILATTQSQLNEESWNLQHCVKIYGEKVRDGKCLIFFIRKKKDPGKSYFTLETDIRGNFRQCRGLRNCSMPDEVKRFVDNFIRYLGELQKGMIAA